MVTGKYRWRRGDRRWRQLRVREAARRFRSPRRAASLRTVLTAALVAELAVGMGQMWSGGAPDIHFLRREESCFVEWVEPGGGKDGDREVYGVRLKPDSLELQFYHRSREILPSE